MKRPENQREVLTLIKESLETTGHFPKYPTGSAGKSLKEKTDSQDFRIFSQGDSIALELILTDPWSFVTIYQAFPSGDVSPEENFFHTTSPSDRTGNEVEQRSHGGNHGPETPPNKKNRTFSTSWKT